MNDQRQMKELRETARDLGIVKFDGDRRKRETWEQAIERQAQIMDIPLDAAYNSIFRTTLLGSRDRVGFEVIEQAIELVVRHCYGCIFKKRPAIVVSFLAFQLACKALPGVSFENIPGVEIEVLVLPESSDTLDTFPAVEIEAQPLPESSDTSDTSPGVEFEPVILSDHFVASYAPPQAQIHYQIEVDGQLSLLDFQVESVVEEAPDFDDFESLDVFREAIARWDSEHPELGISLDSFCEWAPCPDDRFVPVEVLEVTPAIESSSTSEFLLPVFDAWCDRPIESSSTCNFSIPTFDAWCDRTNRNSDEPPTAGVGARLPKPKPPGFPPMAIVAGDRANHIRQFARSATLLSGRAPPGGDAM